MQSEHKPVPRYRFGPIEVDPTAGEIYNSGIKVRVPKKPFQVLLALLERPGEVVTRETLRGQLWSEDTFVEFEHALNTAINRLRLSLEDDAANPRYIETVPGRGYRLIAPVESPERPVMVEPPTPAPAPRWPRRVWLSVIALLVAFIAGMWIGHGIQQLPTVRPLSRFTVLPPPGAVFEPSTGRQAFQLSPDGRYLAFTARSSGMSRSLWIRDFTQSESRELPDSKDAYSVFWSPDGAYIYYTVFNGGALQRVSLTGTPQDLLGHLPPRFFGAWFHRGEIRSADHDHGWAFADLGWRCAHVAHPAALGAADTERRSGNLHRMG